MYVEHEPFDDFEIELRQALERRPAPPSLKRRLLAQRAASARPKAVRRSFIVWQRLAASIVLVAALGSGFAWRHHVEEQRKGEEARQQVLTALRITSHALDHAQAQLAAHDRESENARNSGSQN
jgi:macrodomain Ter protein organizer (MatP/YcbG family)